MRPERPAIIFDLDDTLISERDYALSGFRAVALKFADALGPPARTYADFLSAFDSPDRRRVFHAFAEKRAGRVENDLVEEMIQAYRTHEPAIKLLPDAGRALDSIHPPCALGVITDGRVETQSRKLAAIDAWNLVDHVIMTATLGPDAGKPNPLAFERMSEELGCEAEDCVYVADNPQKDFIAPNQLGWRSVRVRRRDGIYRDAPVAEGGAPELTVETLDNLLALLGWDRTA